MRAMGIDIKKKVKIKGTDYNAEIPFQRNAPSGRFAPDKNQTPVPDQNTVNIAMQQLSQSRRDTAQKKKRQMDIKKFQMLKEQNYEAADAKIKKLREQRMLQDQESRTQLKLPSAVINESQFSEIQKLTNSSGGEVLSSMLQLGNLSVNRESSLQSYARTPSNLKDLMSEAKNSYLLMNAPTPLLAGVDDNASYQAFKPESNNFQKSADQLRTKNILLTSVQRAKQEKGIFKEPLPVNNRKNLAQKQQELLMPNESQIDRSWEQSNDRETEINKEILIEDIKSSISSLPLPKNKKVSPTFQQNLINDKAEESTDIIQLIHNDQLSYRDVPLSLDQIVSQTLSKKSNLPVPLKSISKVEMNQDLNSIQNQYFQKDLGEISKINDEQNTFSKLLLRECDRLILHDQQLVDDEEEVQISKKQFKKAEDLIKQQMDKQEHQYTIKNTKDNFMYFPSFNFISKVNEKTVSNAEKFQAYQLMLKRNQDSNKRMLKKIDNLEGKLNKKFGTFYKKEVGMRENIQKSVQKSLKLKREREIFRVLQYEEDKAGAKRIEDEKQFLYNLRLKEEALQKKYTELNSIKL